MDVYWHYDMAACVGQECPHKQYCARYLGYLVALWEERSQQAHVTPETPGLLCPDHIAATRRECEAIGSITRDFQSTRRYHAKMNAKVKPG